MINGEKEAQEIKNNIERFLGERFSSDKYDVEVGVTFVNVYLYAYIELRELLALSSFVSINGTTMIYNTKDAIRVSMGVPDE